MDTMLILLALLGIFTTVVYSLVIYPVFLSPLATIPAAHWSCHCCPFWLYWMRWTNQENRTVYAKHMELGPALRLSPHVVSINCFEEGLKKIYQGGFPKPLFYFRGFAAYGTHNILTFPDNATHSARKRQVSGVFSKSFVQSSSGARASIRDVLFGRYLRLLHEAAVQDKPVEVLSLNYSYSMDTFVQWQFGRLLGSNMIEDVEERNMYLRGYFGPYPYLFWVYYFPSIAQALRKIGLYIIPREVDDAFGAIEDWNLAKCDQAHQLLKNDTLDPEDKPTIFQQAVKMMSEVDAPPKMYPQRIDIASEMFAYNSAAFETSGSTQTYLFYEMCRNPEWQSRLRDEVLGLNTPLKYVLGKKRETEDIPDPRDVDRLPILHAIVMETLRLHTPVPGAQPRVVPTLCSLAGHDNIPAGTIVQSYAYVLHRTPEIFPDPHQWRPDRWLEADPQQLSMMKHWFWAFGSGGRMCIGSNFALYSMKFLVASVYSNFTTDIHDHGSMEPQDSYLAGPIGQRLEIKFCPL